MDHIEKIKETEASEIPLGKLVLIISRSNFLYLKNHLKDLDLKGYQITMLFEIYKGKNISQHEIGSNYYGFTVADGHSVAEGYAPKVKSLPDEYKQVDFIPSENNKTFNSIKDIRDSMQEVDKEENTLEYKGHYLPPCPDAIVSRGKVTNIVETKDAIFCGRYELVNGKWKSTFRAKLKNFLKN